MTGEALLEEWVAEDFGLDLTAFDEVDRGADENARLWRAVDAAGASYAIKLSGGGTGAGLIVSAHLAARGVHGIPAPVAARDGGVFSDRDGRRLSVVPWISGTSGFDAELSPAQWTAYGRVLAEVHAAPVTAQVASLLPVENHEHGRFSAYAKVVDARVRAHTGDSYAHELAQLWPDAAYLLWALVDRADRLAPVLRARPASNVVCHGDPHVGNLLVGSEGQVWLIDWDDAIHAPIERDLFFVTTGVLAFAPVTPVERSAFLAGYGEMAADPERLNYYLTVRAIDDLTSWANQVLDTSRFNDPERAFALRIVRGLLSPTGLVTLALAA